MEITMARRITGACPVVSFDYAFLSDHDEIVTQEGFEVAGEGAATMLVVRDNKSKAVFAHVVPTKGIDEKGFSVDALVSDVKWLGYNKVTLKSDNEPAIVKLLQERSGRCEFKVLSRLWRSTRQRMILRQTGVQKLVSNFLRGMFGQSDHASSRGLAIGFQCVTR